jgi:membrane protease YdiL (CAAX protease family)
MKVIGFLVTFLIAWLVLDRLAASPPMPIPAVIAAVAAGLVLAVGELVVYRLPLREIPSAIGLGRPVPRALLAAVIVGGLVIAGLLGGAAAIGVTLDLRTDWPLVLLGALLFHGVAEELVWRGFVFARLRENNTFRRAVLLSMPLIALTHAPIIIGNGWVVGGLAMISAAITCLPLAHLWERGGRTIWAPAIVHGMVGTWQLFERTYPVSFSVVVLVVSIVVPLIAFVFGDRFFGRSTVPSEVRSPSVASAG